MKFTPAGRDVRVSLACADRWAIVTIADDGVGMSSEQLSQIQSADSLASAAGTAGEIGAGLSLGLSRALVRRLGGAITIASEQGAGTTVTLRLPLTV